jgi:hypothetical protein
LPKYIEFSFSKNFSFNLLSNLYPCFIIYRKIFVINSFSFLLRCSSSMLFCIVFCFLIRLIFVNIFFFHAAHYFSFLFLVLSFATIMLFLSSCICFSRNYLFLSTLLMDLLWFFSLPRILFCSDNIMFVPFYFFSYF